MSGRPWLEALKGTIREHSSDTDETPEKISEALPSKGRERCESLADEPAPVAAVWTVERVRGSWGEEERRLIAAGWKPKERCGKIIWERPDDGFYVSQEAAIHFLDVGIANISTKAGQTERGNTTG
jgi:hypothetical protein